MNISVRYNHLKMSSRKPMRKIVAAIPEDDNEPISLDLVEEPSLPSFGAKPMDVPPKEPDSGSDTEVADEFPTLEMPALEVPTQTALDVPTKEADSGSDTEVADELPTLEMPALEVPTQDVHSVSVQEPSIKVDTLSVEVPIIDDSEKDSSDPKPKSESEIKKMTVPLLKEECIRMGKTIPSGAFKGDLMDLLGVKWDGPRAKVVKKKIAGDKGEKKVEEEKVPEKIAEEKKVPEKKIAEKKIAEEKVPEEIVEEKIAEEEVEPKTKTEIMKMTVVELKDECRRMGKTIPSKALKADLQGILNGDVFTSPKKVRISNRMKVQELKNLCAERNIEIPKKVKKEELLALLGVHKKAVDTDKPKRPSSSYFLFRTHCRNKCVTSLLEKMLEEETLEDWYTAKINVERIAQNKGTKKDIKIPEGKEHELKTEMVRDLKSRIKAVPKTMLASKLAKWKTMTDKEKKPFVDKADEMMQTYHEKMTKYDSTHERSEKPRKRGVNGYNMFQGSDIRTKIVKENPDIKFGDISRKIGQVWKNMSDEDKAHYKQLADEKNVELGFSKTVKSAK